MEKTYLRNLLRTDLEKRGSLVRVSFNPFIPKKSPNTSTTHLRNLPQTIPPNRRTRQRQHLQSPHILQLKTPHNLIRVINIHINADRPAVSRVFVRVDDVHGKEGGSTVDADAVAAFAVLQKRKVVSHV